MPIITVIATVRAKAGCEEKAKKLLLELVEATHREEGCINYDLHQSIESKGEFVFHENWKSKEVLEAHLNGANLKSFREKLGPLLDGEPVIKRFAKIG